VLPEISQRSSLLATLGFIAESLWDSRSLASIKIRVTCIVLGRSELINGDSLKIPQSFSLFDVAGARRAQYAVCFPPSLREYVFSPRIA